MACFLDAFVTKYRVSPLYSEMSEAICQYEGHSGDVKGSIRRVLDSLADRGLIEIVTEGGKIRAGGIIVRPAEQD